MATFWESTAEYVIAILYFFEHVAVSDTYCLIFLCANLWRLDILHIHKQRLMALDELERAKKENVLLLERIEELEAKELLGSRKGDVDLKFLVHLLQNYG